MDNKNFKTITMEKSIVISPRECNKFFSDNIYRKLVCKYRGNCTKTEGYILEVSPKNREILGNKIDRNGKIRVDVKFNIVTLKPKQGMVLRSTICIILPEGILFETEGKMNIFVPSNENSNFSILEVNEDLLIIETKDGKEYSESENLDVEIIDVKYGENRFNCIGKIFV